MRELRPGLWHWDAPHPAWEPNEPWGPEVSSYALDDGERLLLFDPVAPPAEIEEQADRRELTVVLTSPWHERDTKGLVETRGVHVHTPPPDTQQDLMDKYGVTAERAGDGSPDLRWLKTEHADKARFYASGDRLPFGIDVFPGRECNDVVLWVESHGAVIAGDTLVDFGRGLEINPRWLREAVTWEQVADGLRPLLEVPVEHVLATHGGPHDRAALERALAAPLP